MKWAFAVALLQIKSGARNTQVVEMTLAAIKKLARKHKSLKLAQLASTIISVFTYGGNGVFARRRIRSNTRTSALRRSTRISQFNP